MGVSFAPHGCELQLHSNLFKQVNLGSLFWKNEGWTVSNSRLLILILIAGLCWHLSGWVKAANHPPKIDTATAYTTWDLALHLSWAASNWKSILFFFFWFALPFIYVFSATIPLWVHCQNGCSYGCSVGFSFGFMACIVSRSLAMKPNQHRIVNPNEIQFWQWTFAQLEVALLKLDASHIQIWQK